MPTGAARATLRGRPAGRPDPSSRPVAPTGSIRDTSPPPVIPGAIGAGPTAPPPTRSVATRRPATPTRPTPTRPTWMGLKPTGGTRNASFRIGGYQQAFDEPGYPAGPPAARRDRCARRSAPRGSALDPRPGPAIRDDRPASPHPTRPRRTALPGLRALPRSTRLPPPAATPPTPRFRRATMPPTPATARAAVVRPTIIRPGSTATTAPSGTPVTGTSRRATPARISGVTRAGTTTSTAATTTDPVGAARTVGPTAGSDPAGLSDGRPLPTGPRTAGLPARGPAGHRTTADTAPAPAPGQSPAALRRAPDRQRSGGGRRPVRPSEADRHPGSRRCAVGS